MSKPTQPNVELEAALNRNFFHDVEAMGFIRDGQQEPRITCFRQKTETSTRIFAVLRDTSGEPRFRVLFYVGLLRIKRARQKEEKTTEESP